MIRPRLTIAIGAFLATAIWLASASGTASASSPAEELFQEGRRLLAAGQTDDACARFTESYAMVASSGTLLNLAHCHQMQGKTATAWNEYRAAARLARNQGREDRATVADGKAQTLEPTLARVTTTSVKSVPGLRVATEAGPLGDSGLSIQMPIDPGAHKLTVTAPGYLPWTTMLEVKEAEQLTLEIPRLVAEILPRTALDASPATAVVVHVSPSAPGANGAARSVPRLTLWLGGLGVASLATGMVFAILMEMENSRAKALCTQDNMCTYMTEITQHAQLLTSAERDREIYYVGASVGAASVIAAASWWWRSSHPASRSSNGNLGVAAAPAFSASGALAGVKVAW
jgi:hypothetical protein